jgi:hypothetical protein
MSKGIITLAFGSAKYLRMGRGLGMSIRRLNEDVNLAVVTDGERNRFPMFDRVIPYNPAYGEGVVQKLHLDKYTPFDETLFIDSDCLAYRDPEGLWRIYREAEGFGVLAWNYKDRTDCHPFIDADLGDVFDAVGVSRMPFFNGGLYYFDSSHAAGRVFEEARRIYEMRDEIGFQDFRGAPVNEEPVIALALERTGVSALPFYGGKYMNTCLGADNLGKINVLNGSSHYSKSGSQTEPCIIHFNTPSVQNGYVYRRELARLELEHRGMSPKWASLLAGIEYSGLWTRRKIHRLQSRVKNKGMIGVIPARILDRARAVVQ